MEAMIGSCSTFLKVVSCEEKNRGVFCVKDGGFLSRANKIGTLKSTLFCNHNNNKNNDVNLKLSAVKTVDHISLSSSQTQAEVENQELRLKEPQDNNTYEVKTMHVKIQLQKECFFGQHFLIVGDDPMFGLWDPKNAVPLTWSEGHLWTIDLHIPIEKSINFKFILQKTQGEIMWQPGPNRILETWETEKTVTLCEDWENADFRKIIESNTTLDQIEETPETKIVADNVVATTEESSVTNGTPKLMKKSKVKVPKKSVDSEVKESIESNGYSANGMSVLVSGLSPLTTSDSNQELKNASNDELEFANGAAMVSVGAKDLNLPEFNDNEEREVNKSSKVKETIMVSSINENQETPNSAQEQEFQSIESTKSQTHDTIGWGIEVSSMDENQETHNSAQEQEFQSTESTKSQTHDTIGWAINILQKLLNNLGIR